MSGGHDPFTIEIIKDTLEAISDEMFVSLQRAAQGVVIYEVLDYCVGIADAQGRMIVQGNGVPLFIGTLESAVRAVLAKHGPDGRFHPGDIFALNDPYGGGGTHLSDVCLVMPVFHDGRLVAFTANKGHWSELGGKDPGTVSTATTEVFQEGLQLPNIKLFQRGEPNTAVLDMLAANVRLPEMTVGDMWASVAALRVGESRIRALIGKYGLATFLAAVDGLLDYAEAMTRAAFARLPRGTFVAEDWVENDGVTPDPFRIACRITITDDEFLADFTGSSPMVKGPFNCGRAGLVSAVHAVFKALTSPDSPANHGSFRPVRIVCPEGTVLTARRPAPCSRYQQASLTATDVIWRALAVHVPEHLPAGHLGSVCGTKITGRHPDSGEDFVLIEPLVGGWGAGRDRDGLSGQFCVGNGETMNVPIEVTEVRYGLHVERYELHQADGGEGRFRGGRGAILEYRVTSDEVLFTGDYGRHAFPPWGVEGGHDGSLNAAYVIRADGREEVHSRPCLVAVRKGERIRLVTAHGGGWGDPRLRSRAMVEDDLRNGYITPDQGTRLYGWPPR
jgi:N-methylhydantoinase B